MSDRPTLALIDASGYLYRAFHAIRGLSGPGGRPTNATLGFANMLAKFRKARKPDAIAVCFDRHEKTFRHEMDANYKAQRSAMPDELVPQVEDTKRLCHLMGLAVVELPGFEADDLIGTLACRAAEAGLAVEIASSDKDLFQLVKDGTVAVWHATHEHVLDSAGVKELFGVPPERVVDVLALMGDSSDNIPGVSGIGEKGARELVTAFGPLEAIYERLEEIKGKRKENLEKGRADAFRSRELATVKCDVPIQGEGELLDRYRPKPLDTDGVQSLSAFYDALGFSKLKQDLLLATPEAAASVVRVSAPAGETARWETSAAKLEALVAAARSAGRASIHLECAPGKPYPAEPQAAAVAVPEGEIVAFPLDERGRGVLATLFSDTLVVAHDVKRLFLASNVLGLAPPRRFEDAMLASYVLAPGLHAHDLVGDAHAVLDRAPESIPSAKDVVGAGALSLDALASEAGGKYLGPRAALPLALLEALGSRLAPLREVLDEIEYPLVPVLARMEVTGVAVDRGVLAQMSKDFEKRLLTLENQIHGAAGEGFNVGSPSQLGKILFEKLGYPVVRKTTKTKSYATDSDVLLELASKNLGPLPALVLEWREVSKLKGTYIDALPNHIAADGRIHTRYDQAVAATGRLSSNDPNLQNIPIRTEAGREIRRAFVAPKGRLLVAADYSQVELRLLAHLSGDEALVEVFRKGEDIHRATAAKVFGIAPELVTPDQRRGAKTINFGILYGMGPFALAGQLGVSQADAKAFIQAYFDRFPKIRSTLDVILAKARQNGMTETIFGRVRPIPGLSDRNFNVRSNAERMAQNAPFQGTAADLIKKAMIALDAALLTEIPTARLLLQVHDELVLECDAEDVKRTAALARKTMEGAADLLVPLTVDVGSGQSWKDAK